MRSTEQRIAADPRLLLQLLRRALGRPRLLMLIRVSAAAVSARPLASHAVVSGAGASWCIQALAGRTSCVEAGPPLTTRTPPPTSRSSPPAPRHTPPATHSPPATVHPIVQTHRRRLTATRLPDDDETAFPADGAPAEARRRDEPAQLAASPPLYKGPFLALAEGCCRWSPQLHPIFLPHHRAVVRCLLMLNARRGRLPSPTLPHSKLPLSKRLEALNLPKAVGAPPASAPLREGAAPRDAPNSESPAGSAALSPGESLFSLLPKDVWIHSIVPLIEFGDYQMQPQLALGQFDLASMRAEAREVLRQCDAAVRA